MARPTSRKEWLEIFLHLADRNAPARDFRTQLGIPVSKIRNEIAKIGLYRVELKQLKGIKVVPPEKVEVKVRTIKKKPKKLPTIKEMKNAKDISKRASSRNNSETVGPREDTAEDG